MKRCNKMDCKHISGILCSVNPILPEVDGDVIIICDRFSKQKDQYKSSFK